MAMLRRIILLFLCTFLVIITSGCLNTYYSEDAVSKLIVTKMKEKYNIDIEIDSITKEHGMTGLDKSYYSTKVRLLGTDILFDVTCTVDGKTIKDTYAKIVLDKKIRSVLDNLFIKYHGVVINYEVIYYLTEDSNVSDLNIYLSKSDTFIDINFDLSNYNKYEASKIMFNIGNDLLNNNFKFFMKMTWNDKKISMSSIKNINTLSEGEILERLDR